MTSLVQLCAQLIVLLHALIEKANNTDKSELKPFSQRTFDIHELSSRIVGGESVSIIDAPYQVSLQTTTYFFCGGAVISETHVVTAAHCTYGKNLSDLYVRAGSTFRSYGGQLVPVKHLFEHPYFDRVRADYDIAVVELAFPLLLGKYIKPIALPYANQQFYQDDMAYISGWGVTAENVPSNMAPEGLQLGIVFLMDYQTCQKSNLGRVTLRMLCAAKKEGNTDTCQGDSGGPLVVNNFLVGIVSWGDGCGRPNTPGIYTNIPVVRNFIKQVSGV